MSLMVCHDDNHQLRRSIRARAPLMMAERSIASARPNPAPTTASSEPSTTAARRLPAERFRQGYELRVEVVAPGSPRCL